MMQAIAIDDEPPALRVIERFCAGRDIVSLEKTFTRPDEAKKYLDKYPVDLIFLDIQMPSVSGLEFYRSLKQGSMVIFTTAFTEYAVDGFNMNAIDYLLKPFTEDRFSQAINKAYDYFRYVKNIGNNKEYLFVRADYTLVKISLADIDFIEGLDDYVKIHLENQRPLVARITLKSILEKLPEKLFVRVHRSYIVPLKKVKQVRSKVLTIGTTEISIGNSYEDDFLKRLSDL